MMLNLWVVIRRHFPELYSDFSLLPDYRKRPFYEVRELLVSGLMMFLFRQKSRNQADNYAKNLDYQDNIQKVFGVTIADMDTVHRYLKFLEDEMLEEIKHKMIKSLIATKTLNRYRYKGFYHHVSIDGTGMQSFDYEPYKGCPFKERKNGKRVWTTYVLEAKLITETGFSLSLLTEWIENPGEKFEKQDSELKAFKRLMKKIKQKYPRLPVVLLLDGLYPNNSVFDIAEEYKYLHIITLKDKSLKSVQEQIADAKLSKSYETNSGYYITSTHRISEDYKTFNVEYKNHNLTVVETIVKKQHIKTGKTEEKRFVHITNAGTGKDNAKLVSRTGRLRWKIENEGFNSQKNTGYNLSHKFSRNSFNATKNYYNLLQMADIISQLTFKLSRVQEMMRCYGLTVQVLISKILSLFNSIEITWDEITEDKILIEKKQLRY